MTKEKEQSTQKGSFYSTIAIILLLGAFAYYAIPEIRNKQRPNDSLELVEIPSPTAYPLPKEETTFQVSGGKKSGPRPKSVTFNPLAIENGINQTISISLTDTTNVREVKAKITTDNETRDVTFILKDGTPQDGIWQTNWLVDDTAEKIYKVDFKLVGSEVNDQFGYGFR